MDNILSKREDKAQLQQLHVSLLLSSSLIAPINAHHHTL
jgi:hypothetical protein